MNIAFFINDLQKGGAERLVKDLAIEMKSTHGVNPVVIVSNDLGGLKPELLAEDVLVRSIHVDVTPESLPEAVWKLSKLLNELDIDLVHSHLPFSHVVSRIACKRWSLPHVSTYHNVQDHKSTAKRLAERMTGSFSSHIICVSDGVQQSYPKSERTTVIYNAIDVEGFNQRVQAANTSNLADKHQGETVFLNVARCVEQKRQQDLIEAISLMDIQNIHLYIVGDGPQRERLEKLVIKRGVSDQVTVTGFVESIEPYYAIADAFVSSSSNEGLPTTHIEAMAAKLPIISTNIPGVRELVEEGKTGYLCPVDNPEKFIKKFQAIHEGAGDGFGNRGFKTAKSRFSIKNITNEHLDLYDAILQENRE